MYRDDSPMNPRQRVLRQVKWTAHYLENLRQDLWEANIARAKAIAAIEVAEAELAQLEAELAATPEDQ